MVIMDKLKEIEKYLCYPDDKRFFADYVASREAYLKDETPENLDRLHVAFQRIYISVKHLMVEGRISQATFEDIAETLKTIE